MGRWQKATLAGFLATAACLGAGAWCTSREMSNRRQELESETRVVAGQLAQRLRAGLEQHRIALQQMANFFENSVEVTEEEFYDFASTTLKLGPRCLRVSYVDPSFHVRWVYPPEANRFLVGLDARSKVEAFPTLERALETKDAALSPPLQLIDGPQGFLLAVPIFKQDSFLGEVVGAFRSDQFFASTILPELLERYAERVLDSGVPLSSSDTYAPNDPSIPLVSERFEAARAVWEVRVHPRTEVALARLGSGQAAFWTLAWLLALAAGVAVGAGTYWTSEIATRLRSQGAALQETRQQLDGAMQKLLQTEKLAALGELVAGVAHEINNPLCSILGYSQLVLARDLPPEVRKRVETVRMEAERLGRIVRNLLTFARKHPAEKRHLDLHPILEKTLELRAYHLRVSQIRVETDFDPELPKTMLDPHQIQQAVLNLLNNAEQALHEKGRGGKIRLETRRQGERLAIRVSDDGPGIPEEIQARIFEPFFTTKKDGHGTGLGLSLCYGIVHEHGGEIRVESRAGEGATFIIELPIDSPAQPVRAAEADNAPREIGRPRFQPLRILVVDDERSVQNFLVDYLSSRGHHVETASDVPEALRIISSRRHDLLICDMKMPGGSGRDLYLAVAESTPTLAGRIVFTSGDGATGETLEFVRDIGNEMVLKPFKIEQLEGAIARAVGS